MKTLRLMMLLFIAAAASVYAQGGNQLQKPQNQIIMSGEANRPGWGYNARTITNVIQRYAASYTEMIFDGGTWTVSNHVQFSAGLTRVVIQPGTRFYVGTTNNLAFAGDDFQSGPDNIFYGPGVVTGTVNGLWGCWTNWNALTTPANYYLRCTGLNPQANFIETTNQFGGDVYGVYTNLQLGTGVVTTVEILDGTILTQDLASATFQFITNLTSLSTLSGFLTPQWPTQEYVCAVSTQSLAIAIPTAWTQVTVPTSAVPSWGKTLFGECRIGAIELDVKGRMDLIVRASNGASEHVVHELYYGGLNTNTATSIGTWEMSTSNTFDWCIKAKAYDETALTPTIDNLQYHITIEGYEGYE